MSLDTRHRQLQKQTGVTYLLMPPLQTRAWADFPLPTSAWSIINSYTRKDKPLGIHQQHPVPRSQRECEPSLVLRTQMYCGFGFQLLAYFFPSPTLQSSQLLLIIIFLIDFVAFVYTGQSFSFLYNQEPPLIQKKKNKKFLTMLTGQLLISVSDSCLK